MIVDLHIHSRYARGTSKDIDLKKLAKYARMKGLDLIGFGDVLHKDWLKEIKQSKEIADGIYEAYGMKFLIAGEVAVFGDKHRVHHLILYPSFEDLENFYEEIKNKGYFGDGRPMLKLSSRELAEKLFDTCRDCLLIPAHIWTPYFGVFGSKSGYNSLKEAFGNYEKKIYGIETGLSSDPEMNYAISSLDNKSILSFSDAHSFWPHRLGREATCLDADFTYKSIRKAIMKNKINFTIEVDPAYGKYHFDGHKACNISMHPKEAIKNKNICPICGKKLTLGVLHRVLDLADRELGYIRENSKPYYKTLPLLEIIAKFMHVKNPLSKKVMNYYEKLIRIYGTEFNILLFEDEKKLRENINSSLVDFIMKLRENKIEVIPGYDGKYGKIKEKFIF